MGPCDQTKVMAIAKPLDFGAKLVSAKQAVSPIRAGSRIYIGTGCAAPHSLLAALERASDVEFVNLLTSLAPPQVEGASRTHYGHRAYFVGSEMRGLAASGRLDYVPCAQGTLTTSRDGGYSARNRLFSGSTASRPPLTDSKDSPGGAVAA